MRDTVDLVAVLPISPAEVESQLRVGVNHRFLVRISLGLLVQQVADGRAQDLESIALRLPIGAIADDRHSCLPPRIHEREPARRTGPSHLHCRVAGGAERKEPSEPAHEEPGGNRR